MREDGSGGGPLGSLGSARGRVGNSTPSHRRAEESLHRVTASERARRSVRIGALHSFNHANTKGGEQALEAEAQMLGAR